MGTMVSWDCHVTSFLTMTEKVSPPTLILPPQRGGEKVRNDIK